tara:strand:- start:1984 stop:2535 length:552 start_codon:yes stop_codon:yes gene_type:complete
MPLVIVGGNNNKPIEASPSGRLNVSARVADRAYYNARFDGLAFSWSNLTYNYSAADTILGVYNTSEDKKLHIHTMWLWGDTATVVQVHRPTAATVTMAGTAVTGTNLNGASTNSAPATAKADETGNTQGDIMWSGGIPAANMREVQMDDIITLGQNQMVGVDYVTVGAAAVVTIWGYFEKDDA